MAFTEPNLLARDLDECDLGPYQTKDGIILNPEDALVPEMHEIPVEMPIPACNKYHSTLSCPVTWQLATADNYPVLLKPCGHVILIETSKSLPRHSGDRFHCPTCYSEVRTRELTKLVI